MGRFLRTIAISKLGLATLRARRSRSATSRAAALQSVALQMGTLRGLPQKFGQILHLNELGSREQFFAALPENSQPLPPEVAFDLIEHELKAPIESLFSEISEEAFAASLGQVHRARLLDGTDVAVKVQFPGIEQSLDSDLSLLRWIAKPISNRTEGFDLEDYQRELRESLLREIDYDQELQALERFQRHSRSLLWLTTPQPFPALSSKRVLTMSWINGDDIETLISAPLSVRERAARYLLRFFLLSWLSWGEVHADPHTGNFRFLLEGDALRLGVLDFGCVRRLAASEVAALRELLFFSNGETEQRIFELYLTLGFNADLLFPMRHLLPTVTNEITRPFVSRESWNTQEWHVGEGLSSILGEHRFNFRFAGPPSLLYFIRTFHGLLQYLRLLDISLCWRMEAEELGVISSLLQPINSGTHPMASSATNNVDDERFPRNRELRLRVEESGIQKVQLVFRLRVLENLEDLMSEELVQKLRAQGLNVAEIAQRAIAAGCPPGTLFSIHEEGKSVRVWIQ